MQKLFLTIGCSGSGKSHYFKNQFIKDFPDVYEYLYFHDININDILVCPDNIRKEVTGNISDSSKDSLVWNIAKTNALKTLEKYNFCFFDSTMVSSSNRRTFIKNFDCDIIALVFKPNIELFKTRIENDLKESVDRSNVPPEVIDKQFTSFKNSFIIDPKWTGEWSLIIENKITVQLKNKFKEIYII